MTIHHDKLAYGRLDSLKQDSSEEKLKAMARRLSETKEEEDEEVEKAEAKTSAAPAKGDGSSTIR